MKIEICTALGHSGWEPLAPESRTAAPLGSRLRVQLDPLDELASGELRVNGIPMDREAGQMEWVVPCLPDRSGNTIVSFESPDGTAHTYAIASASPRPDDRLLAELVRFRHCLSEVAPAGTLEWAAFCHAIDSGRLCLLAVRRAHTFSDSGWYLDEIEAALPFLLNVCYGPRTHLRIEEAIRPIAVVRRTGWAALRHIAAHSEHWEARTVSGIQPARLLAHTVDEDLELYENRVVKTLIDRLARLIARRQVEVAAAMGDAENALDWENLAIEVSDFRRQGMLRVLVPSLEQLAEDHHLLEALRDRLDRISRALMECASTRFYQRLRGSAAIQSPLRPTNLLTMDSNYRPLYNLWQLLDQPREEPESALDGVLPADLQAAYADYCSAVLLASLRFSDFQPEHPNAAIGSMEPEGLQVQAAFRRGPWRLALTTRSSANRPAMLRLECRRMQENRFPLPTAFPVPHGLEAEWSDILRVEGAELVFESRPAEERLNRLARWFHLTGRDRMQRGTAARDLKRLDDQWARFIGDIRTRIMDHPTFHLDLVPLLGELGDGPEMIAANTARALDESRSHTESEAIDTTIVLVPTSPRLLPAETPPRVMRRIISYGENLIPEDATQWGNWRAGILPVSPWQINSALRLIRLVNMHTLGIDIRARAELDACPVCGKATIDAQNDGTHVCLVCRTTWNHTHCPYPDCGHQFGWLRPGIRSDHSSRRAAATYPAQMEQLENLAGGVVVNAFCEAANADLVGIPICPKCGRCSREVHYCRDCIRCHAGSIG